MVASTEERLISSSSMTAVTSNLSNVPRTVATIKCLTANCTLACAESLFQVAAWLRPGTRSALLTSAATIIRRIDCSLLLRKFPTKLA